MLMPACFTTGDPPTILDNDSPWWEALGTTGQTDREVSRYTDLILTFSGSLLRPW
jgi:hypothetical protein